MKCAPTPSRSHDSFHPKEHFENRPIPRPVSRHRRVRGGDVRPTGPRLEHDDDFEFQCSVYDLYNRGGVIKLHVQFERAFLIGRYLNDLVDARLVDDLRASIDIDDERVIFDNFLATHYVYDRDGGFYILDRPDRPIVFDTRDLD